MITDIAILVAEAIDKSRAQSTIKPAWIANAVMQRLDPSRVAPPAVYGGCNSYVRQVARSQLRTIFEPDGRSGPAIQHVLFPELQWRYPKAHSADRDDPEYVLTDDMSADDVAYNVARLRAESETKQKHADALEAWFNGRRFAA
jgi:hypothetical protein